MEEIKYSYYPYRLLFKYPFRINHLQRDGTDNVYLLLTSGNNFGWGECVFIPYYTETIHDFKKIISEIKLPNDTNQIEYYIQSIKRKFPKNQFCIAAIDIALHNLHANITNQSIAALYRIVGKADETSFTIGISSNEEMEKKLNENNDQSYFKLKVNQEEISRIVTCYQNLSTKNFTVDANQGFNDREEALAWSYKLADAQVLYMEQPFKKDDLESHRWLKARSPIPIIADESFQTYDDLEKLYKCFDGVNVKIMKCGGIAEGVACLRRAQEMELKTIIGCMSESSVAVHAAFQIAPLANWVDLDGPLLIKNDLFSSKKSNEEYIEELKECSLI